MPRLALAPLLAAVAAALVAAPAARAAPAWDVVPVSSRYVPRGEAAMSQCDADKICLLGGRGNSPVGILDTEKRAWATGKNPPLEIHHFQAFQGPDNCVWVAGAWTGPYPAEDTVDDIIRYCPQNDTWSTVAPIDRPRGSGGAFYYQDAVYLVSGNVGGHNKNANLVSWFDKYDLTTRKWSRLPDIPHPRDHFHAVVVGAKVYVAAGRDSTGDAPAFFNDVEKSVDVYDFASAKWSTLEDFPRGRAGVAATALDGDIFVMGGEGNRNDGKAWKEVEILKGGADAFVEGDDMPTPRHGAGAVTCNGAIWVAGGVMVQGGGAMATDTVAYFDGDTPPVCKASAAPTTTVPTTATATSTTTTATATTATATTATAQPSPSGGATSTPEPTVNPTTSPATSTGETPSPGQSTPAGSPQPSPSGDTSSGASGVTPTASAGEADSGPVCFPSEAVVELRDGSLKTMAELQIGDHVKVSHPDGYSPVYFFSHRNSRVVTDMIQISTSIDSVQLAVSPGHLIYVDGKLAPASSIRIGDEVSVGHDSSATATVTSMTKVSSEGLHNPHTLHGDIIVNGVVASTWTSAVHPLLAKLLLTPFRMMYKVAGPHYAIEKVNRAVLGALDYTIWKEN